MVSWERNWRGAGIGFVVLIEAYALVSEVAWIVWIVVLGGFLVRRASPAKAPEAVAAPAR